MHVNVLGVVVPCQVIGGAMARAGRGSIVNVGSVYGLVSPDQGLYEFRRGAGEEFFKPVAYSVSKSALLNLTRYLATYWGAERRAGQHADPARDRERPAASRSSRRSRPVRRSGG